MKQYFFWIRRKHGAKYERIEIWANDDTQAVNKLPPCVTWDFCID